MTVNFQPYIQNVSTFTRAHNVKPVNAATPASAIMGEASRLGTDIDLVRFVDPVLDRIEGEPGYLIDIYA